MADEMKTAPAADLASLSLADFAGRKDQPFTLQSDGESLELTLIEARDLGWCRPGARGAFSLIFLGPAAPPLPQRMYRLAQGTLVLDGIFLVPLGPGGPDGKGMRYEAVFT